MMLGSHSLDHLDLGQLVNKAQVKKLEGSVRRAFLLSAHLLSAIIRNGTLRGHPN